MSLITLPTAQKSNMRTVSRELQNDCTFVKLLIFVTKGALLGQQFTFYALLISYLKLRTPLPRGSSLCEGMGEGCCTQPYPCICKEAVSGFEPMTNRSPRHNNFTAAPGLAPIFVKSNKNWRLQDNNSFDVHPFTQ